MTVWLFSNHRFLFHDSPLPGTRNRFDLYTDQLNQRLFTSIDEVDRQSYVLFLETFLSLSTDERMIMLESYPYFHPQLMDVLPWRREHAERVLLEVAQHMAAPLSNDYYGNQVRILRLQ